VTVRVVCILTFVLLVACRPSPVDSEGNPAEPEESVVSPSPEEAPSSPAAAPEVPPPVEPQAPEPEPGLEPLSLGGEFIDFEVPGFAPAVISVPHGATEPRPVVVATHGNYDTPEWRCQDWRWIAGDDVWVLCPRGIQRDTPEGQTQRWEYRSNRVLQDELEAGLAALREAYGEYVDDGPMLYTGLSLGAIMGVSILRRTEESFPWAVMIEGGTEWSSSRARGYRRAGGQRILFICGQSWCRRESERSIEELEEVGIEARLVYLEGAGHNFDREMIQRTQDELEWLMAEDAADDVQE